jgi:hypothetical protein
MSHTNVQLWDCLLNTSLTAPFCMLRKHTVQLGSTQFEGTVAGTGESPLTPLLLTGAVLPL